jgi:hypothetical protein
LAFCQITLQAVINCVEKSNKCFKTNPDAWRAASGYGLQLLLLCKLEHYREKVPDEKDLQEKWRKAMIHPVKYVNSLTPKSVPVGTKLILFGRYVLNIYVGMVRYFLHTTKLSAPKSTYRHNAQIGEYRTILTSAKKIRF